MIINILHGDCREVLKTLSDKTFHTCVTSPPYWALRDYGVDDQLGLEETPQEYVANLVEVFKEVRRVLRDDGTVWLNLGDSYYSKNLVGIPWRVAFALQEDEWYLRQAIPGRTAHLPSEASECMTTTLASRQPVGSGP